MRVLTFKIAELPPGLNNIKKMHWAVYGRERDRWALLVREAIGRNNQGFTGRVSIEYHAYRVQLMDKDNHHGSFKLVGDALVKLGIIRDDSPRIIDEELSHYLQEKVSHYTDQRIEVTITDLEEPSLVAKEYLVCGGCSVAINPASTPYRRSRRSRQVLCMSCYLQLNHELKAKGMGPASYDLVKPLKEAC
jgi:hypothetical protein